MEKSLEIVEKEKSSKPKFRRQESTFRKRLSRTGWRRPIGFHSKMRIYHKGKGARVRAGYGSAAKVRGLHRSGLNYFLVHSKTDLIKADPKKDIIVFSASVGMRKKLALANIAKERGFKVLNLDIAQYIGRVAEQLVARKKEHAEKLAMKKKKQKKDKKDDAKQGSKKEQEVSKVTASDQPQVKSEVADDSKTAEKEQQKAGMVAEKQHAASKSAQKSSKIDKPKKIQKKVVRND